MTAARAALVALVLVLLAGAAAAHVPAFAADNTAPATAPQVNPATKSWAIYDSLDPGQVRYYELRLDAGEVLRLGLFTPDDRAMRPSLVVMSPAIDDSESAAGTSGETRAVPGRVTVPEGYGAVVVTGERPDHPSFEPFTPAATYETASYTRTTDTDARYLVAVYEPDGQAGRVGVAAGSRESFTASQYLTVALDLPRIYLWAGDSTLVVFGPVVVVVTTGFRFVRERLDDLDGGRVRYPLALAGLVVAGSATSVLVQLVQALAVTGPVPGAMVTGLFVAIPLLLAALSVRLATDPRFDLSPSGRALVGIVGLGALGTWAGYLFAPLAVLSIALWPKNPLRDG